MKFRAKIQDVEFHAETYNISQLMELPECLYVTQSLKKLHLGIPCVNLWNATGFLALKELRLHGLSSDIPQIISPDFFSKCPALENLSFSDCRLCFLVLTISAPMLKKLEIFNSSFDQVVVSSPLLTSFNFEGSDPINLFMDDKCMLEEVDINVKADGRDEENKATQLLGMLKELANAKYVVVSLDTLKVLSAARNRLKSEPSPFPFLKALKLKTDWSMTRDGWDFLLKDSASEVETSIQLPFPLPRLTRKRFRTF
ncbi:hypothetical protein SOVF_059250 [Spinacia oleracea]|uniref:F-box/LRR-repeat protein At3g28410 n=1 Tax=Spinacia oleracea TaxID=3562 RepID=A0A9R0K5Z6_SPIOL|nr:putative F-box/LRR-repeat protein At3g28410 [Spinacia oleracea]KNA19694.1 hypothetical protein SOVF_059250 [Spinacia oleracea]